MEGGKSINEGLCMPCARELGINTMQQMAGGLDIGDMENLESQVLGIFEGNGEVSEEGNPFASFLSNIFGGFPQKAPDGEAAEKTSSKKENFELYPFLF